ncbi:MAG: hypothetical protein MnENMB40S_16860 [Rhizobiaceae bacterium MnEN-MB40S]|nr:MAG: hypothetical protein MnENMB40S_16860 [Rhizobiaceae bacterium MnEN-MB40S]
MAYGLARSADKPLARIGECDAAMRSNKQRCTDFIFNFANTTADRRRLNGEAERRAPEALLFRCRENISQMTELKLQFFCAPPD